MSPAPLAAGAGAVALLCLAAWRCSASACESDHDAELDRLQREQRDVQRSLYRQTLRLEEHDDSDHPIVALATRRIEELAARQQAVEEAIAKLRVQRPEGAHPDQIVAMLDAVPTCATRSARRTRTS